MCVCVFFCGLAVAGTKKKRVKKKKSSQKAVGWATARLPVLSHDTMECIMTQCLMGQHSAQRARRGRATIRSNKATTRRGRATIRAITR